MADGASGKPQSPATSSKEWHPPWALPLSDKSLYYSDDLLSEEALSNNLKVLSDSGSRVPRSPRIRELLERTRKLIALGRSLGMELAADNLEYWLSCAGGIRTMSKKYFEQDDDIIAQLKNNHRKMIVQGAERRLKSKPEQLFPSSARYMLGGQKIVSPAPNDLLAKGETTLYYEDTNEDYKAKELTVALGGFTVYSEVELRASPLPPEEGGGWRVTIVSWKSKIYDRYNWDPGKYTVIPPFGVIHDDEMLEIEAAGFGKQYMLLSEEWDVTDESLLEPFVVH
ncbi:hypothetical protein [Cohnella sp. REN36]|uniref:hypothetical protein n=1 Tax=Cohnella sp. REN36 TaxID=2887347 RepID=UPI001D15AE05|nr:hypothetical protein [Cohnella sp. REN36]MCC3376190.1 hypothetical protein [Cohnella sp. REN36]